jgi:NAD-dependent dihydropyrimidine dehydrogenase PreA subunit
MEVCLPLPQINNERCTGCGDCVEFCHAAVLTLRNLKAVIARPEDCDYCTECEAVCPVRAITCPFEIVLEESLEAPGLPNVERLPIHAWKQGGSNDQPRP